MCRAQSYRASPTETPVSNRDPASKCSSAGGPPEGPTGDPAATGELAGPAQLPEGAPLAGCSSGVQENSSSLHSLKDSQGPPAPSCFDFSGMCVRGGGSERQPDRKTATTNLRNPNLQQRKQSQNEEPLQKQWQQWQLPAVPYATILPSEIPRYRWEHFLAPPPVPPSLWAPQRN